MKIGKLTYNQLTNELELEDIDLSAKEIQDLNSLINSLKDLQLSYQTIKPPTPTAAKPIKKEES